MKKDYSKFSKKDLLQEVDRLKNELLAKKKYGLVWEEKTEDVVEQCKRQFPVLVQDEKKAINKAPGEPTHLIIEGDNYHALSVLNYTHQGKIDAIYADPPYNTGAKNWLYNNDYVDASDTFRHSKWLSYMERRLQLAKRLLKENGIIVVTIDDYEMATLNLLLNDVFGEENHLGTVVIKSNPSGRSTTAGFAVSHEYALFYARSSKSKIGRLSRTEKQIARYKEEDEIGPYEWVNFRARYTVSSPRLQYPVFIRKDGTDFRIPLLEWEAAKKKYKVLEKPDSGEFIQYPVDDHNNLRCWKWSIDTVKENKKTEMEVRFGPRKQPSVYVKVRMKEEGMLPLTWWDKTEYSATAHGTNLLAKIMSKNKTFDYPKSLFAVLDSLRIMSVNKNALILDFFAGSGTTGHAVSKLNQEDGGKRQFILCTNNENKIAEEVTYPRIKKVIQGYADEKGIPANVRYFKTDFVDKTWSDDENKVAITERCTEMLCIRQGIYKLIADKKAYKIFQQDNRVMAVYYSHSQKDLPKLKKDLDKFAGDKILYCFTLDPLGFSDDDFSGWKGVKIEPIPQKILDVYKSIHGYES